MTYRLNDLYEITFHLVNLLRIQPSEANNLTVPEYRSFIKLYNDVKERERKQIEDMKNNKKSTPRPVLRRKR